MLDSYETKGEVLARKGVPESRTHYIHIQLINSEYWNEFVYFKRYLLDHPETVKEYQELKEKLSVQYAEERKNIQQPRMILFLKYLLKHTKIIKFKNSRLL